MRKGSRLVLVVLAASVLAASLSPLISSKSSNPCLDCHLNYNMYLDILESDPGNTLPTALNDGETLTVAVVLKVTCNAANHRVMSSITATLASQKGFFSVDNPTYSAGSLVNGQTATATWKISPVASGTDVMLITAQGVNTHGPSYFSDSYSPSPSITVTKAVVDLPPSIALSAPATGQRLSGGTDAGVSWTVVDEDKATCKVDLFYSTDDFGTVNETVATALPAGSGYTWVLPKIDSQSVMLKATVRDQKGNFNQTLLGGTFAIDSTAPSILSVLPADQARDVADSAILQVRFSEPVVEYSAQMAFSISPNPGGVTWDWNAERTVMTASHDPFDAQTTYSCSVGNGPRDLSVPGNNYQGTTSWSFTTPDIIVPTPSIVLSAPSGGERLYWGDGINVTWTASGGTGTLAVNLSFSENGTAGPFQPVANDLANSGSYALALPQLVSEACLIEATVHDQNGMEAVARSGLFSLAGDLALVADLPPAGSSFAANNSTTVNWTATGGHGTVVVGLSFQQDANTTPQGILADLPPAGSSLWTAPETNTDSARLLLTATDDWGRSVGVSSGPFSIFTIAPPQPPVEPDQPPVVLLLINEGRAQAGGLLTFDASGSFDPDGDSLYYRWDFGDGTGVINTTTPLLTHVYIEGGDYTLFLLVGDRQLETGQSMVVHVRAAPSSPATGGDEWVLIMLGVIVLLMGSAGMAYAVISRPGPPPAAGPPMEVPPASPAPPASAGETPTAPPASAEADATVTEYVCKTAGGPGQDHYVCAPASPGAPGAGETTFSEVEGSPLAAVPPEPLAFDREKCIGCGTCSKRCPARAISMMDGLPGAVATGKKPRKIPMLNGADCNGCAVCVKNCVKGAIIPVPGMLPRKGG